MTIDKKENTAGCSLLFYSIPYLYWNIQAVAEKHLCVDLKNYLSLIKYISVGVWCDPAWNFMTCGCKNKMYQQVLHALI